MLSDLPLTRDLHSYMLSQFLPFPQILHLCSSKYAACSRLLSFSKLSILPSLFFMKKNFHNLFISIIQAWILLSLTISSDLYSSWIPCCSVTLPKISSSSFALVTTDNLLKSTCCLLHSVSSYLPSRSFFQCPVFSSPWIFELSKPSFPCTLYMVTFWLML